MERAGLFYWVPEGGEAPKHARDPARALARKDATAGPEPGQMGTLFSPCAGIFDLAYEPERQTWARAGRIWIGVERDARIRPEDVQRATVHPGHAVQMAGGMWTIPVARLIAGGSGLPRRRILNPDGTKAWQVEEAFLGLSAFAERAWNVMHGGPEAITEDELDAACGAAISVNYRIGELEAIALGLLTAESEREIVRALVDWPTAMRMLDAAEKKDPTPG